MKEHTPLPWTADGFDVEAGLTTICTTYQWAHGIEPYGVENSEIALANAAFIVKACNSHEQLVAALKEYDEAFTEFNADSKASRHRMRMATIGARAALVSK